VDLNSEQSAPRSLRDLEMEVLAEGREWTRQRLEQKLQEEADRHGGVFPPERAQSVASSTGEDAPTDGVRVDRTGGVVRPKSK
jgi:hypothetical protein